MKVLAKHSCTLLLLLLVVSSCYTIEELSIDYVVPAEVSFPATLRKVGVVNNVNPVADRAIPAKEVKKLASKTDIQSSTTYPEGNAVLATETLAESIAKENYFDEVVICDSALRANDIHLRESALSQNEVKELTQKLNVDLLISLESILLRSKRTIRFASQLGSYWGAVDVKVYPVVRIYLPSRSGPMATLLSNDSIFWEEMGSEPYVRSKLINDSLMIKEASEFAGTLPVKSLIPYWKTDLRCYFSGGTVSLRDAHSYIRDKNWEKAYEIWYKEFQSTKDSKKKMRFAHNITLYYELADKLHEAEEWATKARDLAYEIENFDPENGKFYVSRERYPYSIQSTVYLNEIMRRLELSTKVKVQMDRFGDDF